MILVGKSQFFREILVKNRENIKKYENRLEMRLTKIRFKCKIKKAQLS